MTSTFKTMGLPETIQKALDAIGFITPTPIQQKAIPLALAGHDILGSAATGTGKTAAFGIPLLINLIKSPHGTALIMTPTRELAAQVLSTLKPLLMLHREIKSALLIGGDSMHRQIQHLKQNPRLIVGTPGRINDHLERKTLKLNQTETLVLDETDRMLDMGFGIQIDRVLQHVPKRRQTLLFSATLAPQIIALSSKYLTTPQRVAVDTSHKPAAKIKQEQIQVAVADKYTQLIKQLEARSGSIIVFVKTKHGAAKMAEKLNKNNFRAEAIHGNLQQRKRERVIQAFRDQKYRILVATDVASRGLDIPHIEHVINYDMPQNPEDYIHRIGRTARAGAEGTALSFLTPSDSRMWRDIQRLMNPDQRAINMVSSEERPQSAPRHKRSGRNFSHERPRQGFGKRHSENKFQRRDNQNNRPNSGQNGGIMFDNRRTEDPNKDRGSNSHKPKDRRDPNQSFRKSSGQSYGKSSGRSFGQSFRKSPRQPFRTAQ